MKTTHAIILVVLAVIAGGILFTRMHNPAAFDRLLGGSASPEPSALVPPYSKPSLLNQLAAPAVKAIGATNATTGVLAPSAPANKPTAATPSPAGTPVPSHQPVIAFASAAPVMPVSSAPSPRSSIPSIMNSPSDVINAPAAPAAPEPSSPTSPADSSTPIMSAAPTDSTPPSAAAWTPPSPTPVQPNWTWTTIGGQIYKKVKVLKMDPESVTILHEEGGATIPLDTLPPDLQKLFNYNPAAAAQWGVGKLVAGNLVMLRNGAIQPVNDAQLRSARYIAIYYSAAWNPPCQKFTSQLVKFYNGFKPIHSDFEIILVSEDRDALSMTAYMREANMPWPAVTYGALVHPPGKFRGSGIEAFAGSDIPDLVLLDATGRVLSDSYRDGKYVGPESVLTDIESMVK